MKQHEKQLREQICHIGALMHRQGYINGLAGNISARLSDNRILTTPSGLAKGFISPEQLIIVDLDGNKIEDISGEDLKPTSELSMHLEVYKKRDDVGGVVHAHPPTAIALTIAGVSFQRCLIPEVVVSLGLVPTTPYATPSSTENRDAIATLIDHHDAIMLAYHGSLTVAKDVWLAYLLLETLEQSAQVLYRVEQLGGGEDLPPEQVQKLLASRRKLGFWHEGDEELFAKYCGC